MTDIGQMTATIGMRVTTRTFERCDDDPLIEVVSAVRPVRPGSWQLCAECRRAIEFVPGGRRTLVALTTYANHALQSMALLHTECHERSATTNR